MSSPFANSVRQFNPSTMGGLGGFFGNSGGQQPMVNPSIGGQSVGRAPSYMTTSNANMMGNIGGQQMRQGQPSIQQLQQMQAMTQPIMQTSQPLQQSQRAEPYNPFAENAQYQALMDYRKSMAPQQEQVDRLEELQTAFTNTGGYKDYRISEMERQMQRMQQPRMQQPRMMGIGGMRPNGMQPYQGFGRPQTMQQPQPMQQRQPQQQYGQPQQQYGMMGGYQQNPYQQQRPQAQQFGGYSMGQQMGGFGGYGGMSNPYQPKQMGSYNPNNSMGYGQQQMGQF